MLDVVIPGIIGLIAGVIGGLLGLGGSVIIIPGMILYLAATDRYSGPAQHQLQAAAMICNLFVALPATWVHLQHRAVWITVLKGLAPASLAGVLIGVTISNTTWFARENGILLAILFTVFMAYVMVYNLFRLIRPGHPCREMSVNPDTVPFRRSSSVGLMTGTVAGLLGIGGGSISVPSQQLLLGIPLRNAIANSSATIVLTAAAGAIYKTATLHLHQVRVIDAVQLASILIPTAILGSLIGGKLTHRLPQTVLRLIFVIFMAWIVFQTLMKLLNG